ncbi:unnamed protein product, partial [Gongylonema pulchrum]|uniref:Coiled-coil domain containing 170 n=1 Tax=Gongylonema pulchrum TaxID=637853 RepID=A0A183DI61_9BILA
HKKVQERYEALTETLKNRVTLRNDSEEKVKVLAARLQNIEKCLSSTNCKGKTLEETLSNLLGERDGLINAEKMAVNFR